MIKFKLFMKGDIFMMKSVAKRFTALLLAFVFAVALVPTMSVGAAEVVDRGTCGDNLTWTLDDEGTLTISGTGAMTDYDESDSPFDYNDGIKFVVIENGVTYLGNYAFAGCKSLKKITIPDSVTFIGGWVFIGCGSLEKINIPDSVAKIGAGAFEGCVKLADVVIPNGITNIYGQTFYSCISFKNVSIPDSVTEIGWFAFCGCQGLESIVIPVSVTTIGGDAFLDCPSLTDVYYAGTEEQWNAITKYGEPFTDATTIHYNYMPTEASVSILEKYGDAVSAEIYSFGGSVRVTVDVKDESINPETVRVFAASYSGGVTALEGGADGVFNGTVSGDNYRIFIWDKNLVPITYVYDNNN